MKRFFSLKTGRFRGVPGSPAYRCLGQVVFGLTVSLSFSGFLSSLNAASLNAAPTAPVDFAHDIVPILKNHCAECHTGDKKKGGLSFNTRADLMAGSESGKVVVPGKAKESRLIQVVVSSEESERMPPKGPRLSAAQVAKLTAWIDEGAKWEDGFAFKKPAYEPPLKPRRPNLPVAQNGRTHPIDRILDAYQVKKGVKTPEAVADGAFARRAYLDLIGLLPTSEVLKSFTASTSPSKRQDLVRELLSRDQEFAEHWLTFWNDLLRNDYAGTGYIDGGRKQISPWLYQALIANKPYDQMAKELIAPNAESEGFSKGIQWRGNVSAGQLVPIQFAQSLGQSFLGINLKCASCHDSFIDRWKLSESYGLAAIYTDKPLEIHRCDKPIGKTATPSWIFPELGQVDPKLSQPERLKQLAALMTHPQNGRFTRTIVNRLWNQLMGRGIVHPLDAMQTEPWESDLLDFLASDLADNGYNLRKTLELIATSEAYAARCQILSKDTDGKTFVYEGPRARRMSAEQFLDAIWSITGTAPTKIDAPITRGTSAKTNPKAMRTTASWIWSNDHPANEQPAAGEVRTFRKVWELAEKPLKAGAVATCDNGFSLYVNGSLLVSDDDWQTVSEVNLAPHLHEGANEIVIVGRNAGDGPNLAGLIFEAKAQDAKGKIHTLATNESWNWTKEVPNAAGRFASEKIDWKPAAKLAGGVWNPRVGADLNLALAQILNGSPRMVRASLMKSDFLMRTLGRPNREQIVSMRPAELTTLEAIDLHNAETFASLLERGAQNLARRQWDSPSAFTNWLSQAALCREPTDKEKALYLEILGPKMESRSIEDLLWVIFMLPEFQWVR